MADWFNNKAQREMSAEQYQRAIKQLGLSQQAAGRFLGVSERTAKRLASGEAEVPVAVALLLRRLIADGETIEA